ncbi:MAG: hypothetical protein ACOYCB_12710 [Fastidiosipilaceae bacterium]|jgi:hypothetical protein
MKDDFNYWKWLLKGSGGNPGYRRMFDIWMIIHFGIGLFLARIIPGSLERSASMVLIPLVGLFFSLSFTWIGNAQALMQSKEINELANYHEGGFIEYVYVYQTSILMVIIVLILWVLAGLSLFDLRWPTKEDVIFYYIIKAILFSSLSLTIRESWNAIIGTQWMLIAQRIIKSRNN